MAKRAAAAAPAAETKKPGTAVANWDEQMARDAEVAAAMEANAGGGQFFSVKGGVLTFGDIAVPNNTMGVIIVDSILENVFFADEYDPENPAPPVCFAFSREESEMAPHETVVAHDQAQNDQCAGCPMNAWGTADKGRGKACRNTRRLAMIPAGEFDEKGNFKAFTDAEHFEKAPIGFMKLPVTSVKGYASYVKQISAALKRPPYGVFTKVKVVPDAKTQFKVDVTPIDKVPAFLSEAINARRAEAALSIDQPYNLDGESEGGGRPEVKGRAARPSPVAKRPPVKGKAATPAKKAAGKGRF